MTRTIDQIRDAIAERLGLPIPPHSEPCGNCLGTGIVAGVQEYTTDHCAACDGKGRVVISHPIPASLDWFAGFWKEKLPGWTWRRRGSMLELLWSAHELGKFRSAITVPDTGDELHDRAALTLAVLETGTI